MVLRHGVVFLVSTIPIPGIRTVFGGAGGYLPGKIPAMVCNRLFSPRPNNGTSLNTGVAHFG